MGDKIKVGKPNLVLAWDLLVEMNKMIKDLIREIDIIMDNRNSQTDADKAVKKGLELIKRLKKIKMIILKALAIQKLYKEMNELDELIYDAELYIRVSIRLIGIPCDKKEENKKLVALLQKIRDKKDSIEDMMPNLWRDTKKRMGIMNSILKSLISAVKKGGILTLEEVKNLTHHLHAVKKSAISYIPEFLCSKDLEWWYRRFASINLTLESVEKDFEKDSKTYGRYRFFFAKTILESSHLLKKDMENQIAEYK